MRRSRRALLAGALCAAIAGSAGAHTPYGQWVVYRQKHLLIGAHRGDARTYALAKAIAAALADELPEAKARVARGPRPQRIASLMGTGQLLTAVLSMPEAAAMTVAAAPFENYRPVELRSLAALDDDYALFASTLLPSDHAWLLVQALDHAGLAVAPSTGEIAGHPGADAFWRGDPAPS
ncbi:MAG: hypothetical protein AAFT19_01835 [Pseudomonadota bacterium]